MHTTLLTSLPDQTAPSAGLVLVAVLLSVLPAVLVYVWTALALSRVYAKLGVEGWKAWVPVYNAVVFLGLGGLSGWLLLLALIPFFGAIFVYVALVTAAHRVGAAFGHGAGMTVLAALLFPVWASVLGFGSSRPVAGAAPYAYTTGEDAEAAFRALSPEFGQGAYPEQPVLSPPGGYPEDARRSPHDIPAPSAWIPAAPAPDAPGFAPAAYPPPPAPAPAAPSAPPPAPAVAPPPAAAPEPLTGSPWAPAASPTEAPPSAASAVPAPPAWEEPAPAEPVTSWWMPAPEQADAPSAPPAFVEPAPAPTPAAAPAPEPAPQPVAPAPAAADEWAPAPAASLPAATTEEPPVLRQAYLPETDAFPEESGAVSAVVGAPTAGAPRAAAASVSAVRPSMGDFVDDTVIASRKRPMWALELPDGTSVELASESVVLGRRPAPVPTAPGAQLVTVDEPTRTVSKTHAVLRRQGEQWLITDLGSTNGVMVDDEEVQPGASVALSDGFLLGDAAVRLVRRDR